jgi:alkylation response protein AidB-like acyl-CoA dehydrogenase
VDFSFTEEQTLLRDSIRKLMDRIATPEYVRRLDREQTYPYELYEAWVEAGMLRLPYPEFGRVVCLGSQARLLAGQAFQAL